MDLFITTQKINFKCYVFKKSDDKPIKKLYFTHFFAKTKMMQTVLIEKLRKIKSTGLTNLGIENIFIPTSISFFDKNGGYTLQGTVNKSKFKKLSEVNFSDPNKYKNDSNYITYQSLINTHSNLDLQPIIFSIKNEKDYILDKTSLKTGKNDTNILIENKTLHKVKSICTNLSEDVNSIFYTMREVYPREIDMINKTNNCIRNLRDVKKLCENIIEINKNIVPIVSTDSINNTSIFIYNSPVVYYRLNMDINTLNVDGRLLEPKKIKAIYETILNKNRENMHDRNILISDINESIEKVMNQERTGVCLSDNQRDLYSSDRIVEFDEKNNGGESSLENDEDESLRENNEKESDFIESTTKEIKKSPEILEKIEKLKIWIDNHIVDDMYNFIYKDRLFNFYECECECLNNHEKFQNKTFVKEFTNILNCDDRFLFFKSKRFDYPGKRKKYVDENSKKEVPHKKLQYYSGINYVPHGCECNKFLFLSA